MAHFSLTLMKERSQYSPTLRRTFPRVNVKYTPRVSDVILNKWAVIIIETANFEGHELDMTTARIMAHYAMHARAKGVCYSNAVLGVIDSFL